MNVYDKAHETARALKESLQYKKYLQAREGLKANQEIWNMFKDFRKRQKEIQQMILSGQEPSREKVEEARHLLEIVTSAPQVGEFLRCELELVRVVEDIQHILLRAVDLELEDEE